MIRALLARVRTNATRPAEDADFLLPISVLAITWWTHRVKTMLDAKVERLAQLDTAIAAAEHHLAHLVEPIVPAADEESFEEVPA
jgi:hypothetical protein